MHTIQQMIIETRTPTTTPVFSTSSSQLCELLLDKEGPQMRQLPGARRGEHRQLDQNPPHHARVGALGLIAEFGFTFLRFIPVSVSCCCPPHHLGSKRGENGNGGWT
jgi:hypothetical protein